MVTLQWTKSSSPLSKLIRWGLSEPCSHFSVCLDDKLVFHSNLLGTGLKWLPTFLKKHTLVESGGLKLSPQNEEVLYQNLIKLDERPYNFMAFGYFIWRALLWRIFKMPFPKKSSNSKNRGLLCTEVAQALKPFIVVPDDLDIVSPYQLYRSVVQGIIEFNRVQDLAKQEASPVTVTEEKPPQ